MNTETIYQEIWMPVKRQAQVEFPNTCPVCDSVTQKEKDTSWIQQGPVYGCGGQYENKPQVQSHTEKWSGVCGNGQGLTSTE